MLLVMEMSLSRRSQEAFSGLWLCWVLVCGADEADPCFTLFFLEEENS